MSEENTSLVPLNKENAVEFFKPNGLDPIIEKIRKQVAQLKPDTSTDAGRKEISKNARAVASAKVALDKFRKEFVSTEKERLKAIDAEGGRAWDELEALQKEVRKPLDEWEEIDEKRVKKHKDALDAINSITPRPGVTLIALKMNLTTLQSYKQVDFEEFSDLANDSIASMEKTLTDAIAEQTRIEAERAELEQMRKEKAERDERDRQEQLRRDEEQRKREQAEREEKIKQEASANAERIANEKAERDRQETARKAQEEIDKAKRDKEDADRRAESAAAAQKASEEKAKRERIEAAEKAQREQEEAVERERRRQENERIAQAQEDAKREANQKHRDTIKVEACFILKNLIGDEDAFRVFDAIAAGNIPHAKIIY